MTSHICLDGCPRKVLPNSNYCAFHTDSRAMAARIQRLEKKPQTRNKATAVRELKGEHKWLKQQHGAKARSTPEVVLLISTTDAAESEKFVVGDDDPRRYAYAIFRTNHGKKWKEAECAGCDAMRRWIEVENKPTPVYHVFETHGVHANGHAPVQRRYVNWNDAQNKSLHEYFCFNSRVTPSDIILSSLDPHAFAGISAKDITNWRRKNKSNIGDTRRK